MKFVYCLFAMYIVFLLTIPCQDDFDFTISNSTQNKPPHNHDKDGHDCHTCSPFCVCNCCHANTIVALKSIFTHVENVPTIVACIYKEVTVEDIILTIWQPPKL